MLRSIRLLSGCTLSTDDARDYHGRTAISYTFSVPRSLMPRSTVGGDCPACNGTMRKHGAPYIGGAKCINDRPAPLVPLFTGADFYPSPMHATDSDACLLALLSFLALRPGDTDADYFDGYNPAQLAWTESSECEQLSGDVSMAEDAGGCACGALWTNEDGHVCEDAPTVTTFRVLDHGEDGSQYFPGCPSSPDFAFQVTAPGDTAKEALENILEQMAMEEHKVSPIQEAEMLASLHNPEQSAHAGLESHDCEKDQCDWSHWVTVRYSAIEGD